MANVCKNKFRHSRCNVNELTPMNIVAKINFDIRDAMLMSKTPMNGSCKNTFRHSRCTVKSNKLRWTEVSKINFDKEIIIGKEFQWTDALCIRFRHSKCKIMSREFRWTEIAKLNFDIQDAS